MRRFHYVRILGEDGGVDACEDHAIGLDVETVLRDGLPPMRVALQVIAGLCEIFDIAEEDNRVHGDLRVEHVFIDDTGAISVEGFGQRHSRAPERDRVDTLTDLYGIGAIAYQLISGSPLPDLPGDSERHDDAVIDLVLEISFGDLNEEMVGDVQWFIAKLLSFDPVDRPPAVETWRTFIAFAESARGPDFVSWCLDALDGGGLRRGAAAPPEEGSPLRTNDLEGPLMSQGPLKQGGIAFQAAGGAAGGTAFFTKEDMRAALDSEAKRPKPAAGGGEATSYWTKQDLANMEKNDSQAPRPKRADEDAKARRTMGISKADLLSLIHI